MRPYLCFVAVASFLGFSPSGTACQMVCNGSNERIDLILCDKDHSFQTIVWFKGDDGVSSSIDLSEALACAIDNNDGRITACSMPGHSFKSRIERRVVLEIDQTSKKTTQVDAAYLHVAIESPLVEAIPKRLLQGHKTKLNLSFALKDCSAKSTEDRLRGRR